MELNCLGETCPMPVIKTKKALAEITEGGFVSVLVDNIEAMENIEKMIQDMAFPYETKEDNGNFNITITKGNAPITENIKTPEKKESKNGTVVVISSNKMGDGDEELGQTLLRTFIYTLTELDVLPKTIVFYNSGVKMTTIDAQSVKDIKTLQDSGVEIMNCGACLNFYGLTDSLKVGRVSNMYEIANILLTAERVVKP